MSIAVVADLLRRAISAHGTDKSSLVHFVGTLLSVVFTGLRRNVGTASRRFQHHHIGNSGDFIQEFRVHATISGILILKRVMTPPISGDRIVVCVDIKPWKRYCRDVSIIGLVSARILIAMRYRLTITGANNVEKHVVLIFGLAPACLAISTDATNVEKHYFIGTMCETKTT